MAGELGGRRETALGHRHRPVLGAVLGDALSALLVAAVAAVLALDASFDWRPQHVGALVAVARRLEVVVVEAVRPSVTRVVSSSGAATDRATGGAAAHACRVRRHIHQLASHQDLQS